VADEALTAGAVARRLGVAVTTLRTWHQRYGLGPSHHVPGQHRRYTSDDLERLQIMRRLTAQGVAPAEAAAWAKRVPIDLAASLPPPPDPISPPPASPPTASPPTGRGGFGAAGGGSGAAPVDDWPVVEERGTSPARPSSGGSSESRGGRGDRLGGSAEHGHHARRMPADLWAVRARREQSRQATMDITWADPELPFKISTRYGGGHTIPTGRSGPVARGLARAAVRLDTPELRETLATYIERHGVIAAWDDAIRPVLAGIGERFAVTERYVEVEHLFTRVVSEVLSGVARPPRDRMPRALLASADEDQHTLPLEALAAALAERGVPTRMFGARMPVRALADAVERTGPTAVVLWSQTAETGDPAQWVRLASARHVPLVNAAAGPGWHTEGMPEGVIRLNNLPDAVRLTIAAVAPELMDSPAKV
jgi:MerR family transcriptional regulator, light-induced transcriptional regulator